MLPTLKFKDGREANCEVVRRSKPVALSKTPPVARWYFWNASLQINLLRLISTNTKTLNIPVARRTRVVPVSTIPAVWARIEVEPKLTDWSMPQNSFAGEVLVIGLE